MIKKLLNFNIFFVLFLATNMALAASNSGFVYSGRILKPDGQPINAGNLAITVSVYSPAPSSCLLYQEQFSGVDMTNKNGTFSVTLGLPTPLGTRLDSTGYTFNQLISNAGTTFTGLTCASGTTYTPAAKDERVLAASFNDGAAVVTVDNLEIKSVPYAMQAAEVSGYGIMNLAKISGAGSAQVLSPFEFDFLKNLSAPASASATPCAANQILKMNAGGTAWECAADGGGSGETTTVTNIAGGTGIYKDMTVAQINLRPIGGTANQVAVGLVGDVVTLSLPQDIHTGATPTFATPTLAGHAVIKSYADATWLGQPATAPANPANQGQSIRWNAAGTAWEYYTPSTGSVTSVGIGTNSDLILSNTGTAAAPILSFGAGTATGQTFYWDHAATDWKVGAVQYPNTAASVPVNSIMVGNNLVADQVSPLLAPTMPSVMLTETATNRPRWENGSNGTFLRGSAAGVSWGALAAGDIPDISGTYWKLGGNAPGAVGVIGTTDANAVNIISNNSSRIYIDNAGKVGIGAIGPLDTLSIGVAPVASATRAQVNLSNTALVGGSANGTYIGANPAAYTGDFVNFQVGDATVFKVSNTGVITGNGSGLSNVAASSLKLNALTAADNTNTIDNLDFAQTWNWSTADTESPLSINANAITTGSLLTLATSNATVNSTNGLLNVANTGASTTGVLARFQSNSTAGSGMTILASGNVGIGTTAPSQKLSVAGGILIGAEADANVLSSVTANDVAIAGAHFHSAYGVYVGSSGATRTTGMTLSGPGHLAFLTSNTERMYVKNDGNVGLGAVPLDPLSIGIAVPASATRSLVNLSNTALVGASANGTYIGANPAAFTGDFINLQVGDATVFKVSNTGVVTGNGSGLSNVAASSLKLNALTAADATNTIDNLDFAQTWNWSTADTESPLSINANALTTGSLLTLATSNASVNSTNGLLNVANTGASTTGVLARFQSNSTAGSGLTVLNSGNVGIGTTAPGNPLTIVSATAASLRLASPAAANVRPFIAFDDVPQGARWDLGMDPNSLTNGFGLKDNDGNTMPFFVSDGSPTSSIYVASSGNVGLGTGTPTAGKLVVAGGTVTTDVNTVNLSQTWNNAGVLFTGIKSNVTDTASNANSLLLDLQVNGTSEFRVDKTGKVYGDGSGLTGVSASSLKLNALTAADATNTIDNLDFAQTWNWSTADTESPLTVNANALTTGSMLTLATSNATVNSTNGLLNVANTGASTTGMLARFQSNSTAGSGLTVLTSGNVGVGTSAPGQKFQVDGGNTYLKPSGTNGILFDANGANPRIFSADGVILQSNATSGFNFKVTKPGGAATDTSNILEVDSTGLLTSSSNVFVVHSSGTPLFNVKQSGNVGIGNSGPGSRLSVNVPTTAIATTEAQISATAATQKALVLQAKAAQSANMFEVQDSTGAPLAYINSGGMIVSTQPIISGSYLATNSGNVISSSSSAERGLYLHGGNSAGQWAATTDASSVSVTGTFNPTSTNAKLIGLTVNPTINQTGTANGDYTGLLVNVVETAATGTNKNLIEAQVSGVTKFRVDNTGKVFGDGSGLTGVSASGALISGLTAANATNTIDNTNFAQTWNWSTATTQNPLSLSANALTTGSLLNLTTSSASVNSTNGLLNVANTSAGTTGILARFQSNSTAGSGLTVLASGNVGVGTAAPSYPLHVTSGTEAGRITYTNSGGGTAFTVESTDTDAGKVSVSYNSVGGPELGINSTGNFGHLALYQNGVKQIQMGHTFANGQNITSKTHVQIGIDADNSGTGTFEVAKGNSWNGRAGIDGTSYFRILNNGNVGINNNNPGAKLEINASADSVAIKSSGYSLTGANAQSLIDLAGTWNTTGTPTLIKANVTDTASNAASLLMDLQVGGVSKFKVDKTGKITGDGSGLTGVSASGVKLSGVTAADAVNTIDNLNFAQTWNWSTLNTQTAVTTNANAITSGKVRSIASSSTAFTGVMDEITLSGDNAANTGTLKKLSVSGATSAAVPMMITNLGTGSSFRVNDETGDADATPFIIDNAGNVGIGYPAPDYKLKVNGNGYFGTGIVTGVGLNQTSDGVMTFGGTNSRVILNGNGGAANYSRVEYQVQGATKFYGGTTSATGPFTISTDGGANGINILQSGNVGIGTVSPTAGKFVVTGGTVTTDLNAINVAQTWNNAGVLFTGIEADFTDTASDANSLLLDLKVGGVSEFRVDKTGKVYGDGSGLTGVSASGVKLSGVTAADAVDTIDNLNFAQTWNWSTLNTQTAMTTNANAITSGKVRSIASSSTAFTGVMDDITLSGDNAANTGTLKKLSVTGATSAAVPMMITNLGTGASFRVNDETGDADATPFLIDAAGKVGIGTASPTGKMEIVGGPVLFSGAAGDGQMYFSGNSLNGQYASNANGIFYLNYTGYNGGTTQFRDTQISDGKAGNLAFFQGSTGRVGIGTAGPASTLHLAGPAGATTLGLTITNATDNANIFFRKASGVDNGLELGSTNQRAVIFSNNAERMRFDSTGNIIVGTTSPGDSGGNFDIRYPTTAINRGGGSKSQLFVADSGGSQAADAGGRIDLGGYSAGLGKAYTWGGMKGAAEAAAGNKGYLALFTQDSGSSLVERMRINGDGNVGVGTVAPTAGKFVVSGGTVTTDLNAVNVSQTWNNAGVLFTGIEADFTDTASDANSLLLDLKVGGVSEFRVDKTGKVYGDGSGLTGVSASGVKLSGITAADATNTIDNLNFAQTWNWSTLNTQTAMLTNANAITSGKVRSIASTATGFTGVMDEITLTGNNAANTGVLNKLTVTGASSLAIPQMITNGGAGLSLRINDDGTDTDSTPFVVKADGNVGIGTDTPNYTLVTSTDTGLNRIHQSSGTGGSEHVLATVGGGASLTMQTANAGPAFEILSGNTLGSWITTGYDTGSYRMASIIRTEADANFAAGSAPGRITFHTTPSGSTTPAERIRIDSTGKVGIASNNPGAQLQINTGAIANIGQIIKWGAAGQTANLLEFQNNAGAILARVDKDGKFYGDGSNLTGVASSSHIAGGNTGYIPFQTGVGATGFDGSNFIWDDTNNRLGIGTSAPAVSLDIRAGAYGNNQNFGINIGTPTGANGWLGGLKLKSDGSGIQRLAIESPTDATFGVTEVISIQGTGVGIGIAAPTTSLVVGDGFQVQGAASPKYPTAGAGLELVYDSDLVTETTGLSKIQSYSRDAAAWKDLKISAYSIGLAPSGLGGASAMHIMNDGKVGIGTTAPQAKLQIGDTTLAAGLQSKAFNIISANGGNAGGFIFEVPTMNNPNRIFKFDTSGQTIMTIQGHNANDATVATDTNISLQPNGGNVGIGTTSPAATYKLNLAGATTDDGMRIDLAAATSNNVLISYSGANVTHNMYTSSDSAFYAMHSAGTEKVRLSTNSASFFNGGSVGIGTSSPGFSVPYAGTARNLSITGDSTESVAAVGVITLANNRPTPSSSDEMGQIDFASVGNGAGGAQIGSRIIAYNEGAGGANGFGGNIQFHTKTNNAAATTEKMRITASGNVGIGTSNPAVPLDVVAPDSGVMRLQSSAPSANGNPTYTYYMNKNNAEAMTYTAYHGAVITDTTAASIDSDFVIGVMNNSGWNQAFRIFSTGDATLVGTLTQNSDIRLKEDITPIPDALARVTQLDGVNYYWKDKTRGEERQIGLIAQEVEKQFPEAVKTNDDGIKSVAYQNLIAPVISAVKDLYKKWKSDSQEIHQTLEKQQREIASVKKENEELKARLERLEKALANPIDK